MDLSAGLADVSHDDGVLIVGLAEDEHLGWQLVFQLADSFDDQDRTLGMDTYCVVSGWQEGTNYGGVESWKVEDRLLTLRFSREAARELGLAREVRVTLEVDPGLIARLIEAMTKIVGHQRG